jgi:hypothetical protein
MAQDLFMAAIDPQENMWDKVEGIWNEDNLLFSLLPPTSFFYSELPISLTGKTLVDNPFYPFPPMYQGWIDRYERAKNMFAVSQKEKDDQGLKKNMEKDFMVWLKESGSIYEVTGLMNVEKDGLSSAV